MSDLRDPVLDALHFRPPAYVPWAWKMTIPCRQRVSEFLGGQPAETMLESHFLDIKSPVRRYEPIGEGLVRDSFGVTWDRSVDPDIGTPVDWPLREPKDLLRYRFPVADDASLYEFVGPELKQSRGRFGRFCIGLSLYERAWTLRGMTQLFEDMIDRPEFVEELFDAIADHTIQQVHQALKFDFDAFHFGDDYGMQTGLIMGLDRWRRLFKPRLARIFEPVRKAGKFIFLHSCGKVESLLDDFVEIGLSCLDPFQPEVMDTVALIKKYHGRLAFHGGLSIQKTLPFGSQADVRRQTQRLIDAGSAGGLIFSPAHAVPGDVPPENLRAMMDVLKAQPGYRASFGSQTL